MQIDMRVMCRITKKMERNQLCVLFMHALSKDVVGIIRSFMPIRPLLAKNIVSECKSQRFAIAEQAYEDMANSEYVLPKSQITLPKYHEKGQLFIRTLESGCGKCRACERNHFLESKTWRVYVPCAGCENENCNNPDHTI